MNAQTKTNDSTKPTSRAGSRARRQAETGNTQAGQANEEKGKMPPPRQESNNTTQGSEPVEQKPTPLYILAASNPKRMNTQAHKFFGFYYDPKGEHNGRLTTLEAAYARGVRGKDRSWDADRGHILLGDDVAAYLALKTDDDRRAWLKAKFGNESVFKVAGLVVAPPPAEDAQKTEPEKATA